MQLVNGRVRFEFDDTTGVLRQIKDLASGKEYLPDPRGHRLVKLIVPTREHSTRPLFSQAAEPQFRKRGDTLTIEFPPLTDDGAPTGVSIRVSVRLPAGSPEAFFTLEVRNSGPDTVQEVWFPWLGGYNGTTADRFTHSKSSAWDPPRTGLPLQRTHAFGRHHQRHSLNPASLLPMLDLSNGQGGLSYIKYARQPDFLDLVFENHGAEYRNPCLSWAWASRPFVRPGETWRSPEFGVGVHQGDWHVTADRLRTFAEKWWQPSGMPDSLREKIGVYHVQFHGFNGERYHELEELPALARDCLQYGVRDLCLWDTPAQIYLRPDRGGFWEMPARRRRTLQRVLAEVRQMGCQTGAWVNFRLITEYNRLWKELGSEVQRSVFGTKLPDSWPCSMNHAGYQCSLIDQGGHPLCFGSKKVQRFADQLVDQTLALGFTSLYIDQAAEWNSCLADNHGHRTPAAAFAQTYSWFRRAAQRTHRRHPEFYTVGEVPDLYNTQALDLWWHWDWRAAYRSEVFRYVLPDMLACWCIDENERDVLAKAFALGHFLAIATRDMTGRLSDEPALAAQIARLATLRQATAAYVAHGRFLDNRGLTVDGGEAYTFKSDAGLAVTMANTRETAAIVRVALAPEAVDFVASPQGLLHIEGAAARPVCSQHRGTSWLLEAKLPAYGAGVWTLPAPGHAASCRPRGG